MVGWDVSRHPEWDMMYAAGLTVREIADRCHQNCSTIHLHFRVREKYEPGFHARHEAALKARGPNRPTTLWRKRASEAIDFQTAHGRLPRGDGDAAERSLHSWLEGQRRTFERGEMPASKVVLLEDLVGWNIRTRQLELDGRWWDKLSALVEFVASTESVPRYKNYSTEQERVLGVWLHKQHQRRSENKLVQWRLETLDAALPGWRSHM